MRRAVLIALAALLLAAPAAGARIVIGKGMAGVRLEMTAGKVRQLLGTPTRVRHKHNEFGAYTQYIYPARRLRVNFQGGNRVTSVTTTSASERTRTGVGVGSTRTEVRSGVRHVHCSGRVCQVGQSLPGRRVTAFFLDRARTKVVRVLIGFVLD